MQDINLGPYRINPRGEIQPTEQYKFFDMVSYKGSTYLNINESTNNANSLIYINDSSQFGSLAFPISSDLSKNESFILTSKKKNEAAGQGGWKWTNILDLPLTNSSVSPKAS